MGVLNWLYGLYGNDKGGSPAAPNNSKGYLFDNQSGNSLAPGSFSPVVGDKNSYSYMPNGSGGLNYFSGGNPISNSQYGAATGQDYGALEKAAANTFKNGSVLGAGTTGGGAAYDPNTDPNLVGQARGMVGADQNQLNSLFAAINGQLGTYANDARGRVDKSYGDSMTANDKSYASGVAGTNAAYGSRGAYDSSYRGNDLTTAKDAYTQSNSSLSDQKNQAYAGIGSTIQSVQNQLEPDKYDLSQYKDVNALTSLHNQLGQHIAQLRGTQQQLTPQGELVQKLNSVASPTSNLDATLKGQLEGLVKANTPSEAINPLATAYLTRAGITDPAKQKNYFDYLKTLTAPTPSANNLQLQGA